jgi:hypothetical protein
MAKPSLEDYIEVPERIQRFYAQYPDGSLQGTWEVVEVAGDTLIVYTARAYRSSQDPTPGVGTASEPYPGKTSFTKGSELMNAETSAWGRAIVSLGFLAKDEKVASKEEVKGAQARNVADEVAALPGTVEYANVEQLEKLDKARVAVGAKKFDTYLRAQGVDNPGELTGELAESVLTWARGQTKRQVAA